MLKTNIKLEPWEELNSSLKRFGAFCNKGDVQLKSPQSTQHNMHANTKKNQITSTPYISLP